jgi:hypothetical protein
VARPVRIELVLGKPVRVDALDADVTLVSTKEALVADPESGQRHHVTTGLLRVARKDMSEEVAFGPSGGATFDGYALSVSHNILSVRPRP